MWVLAGVATIIMLTTASPGSIVTGLASGTLFYVAGAAVVGAAVRDDRRFAMHVFTAAFLARYVFTIVLLATMTWAGVDHLEGGRDYLGYDAGGWYLAQNWRAGVLEFTVADKDPGYYFVVAAVYTVFGHFQIAPTLFNALFGGLAAVVVFLLGREMFDRRTGVIAALLAAFLPTLLFWSSLLYKDTILACAMGWAFYLAVRVGRARTRRNALWLGLSFLPVFMMRPESAMTLGAAVGLLILWSSRVHLGRVLGFVAALGVLVLLMTALEVVGLGGKSSVLGRFVNPMRLVFEHREGWADVVGVNVTGFSRMLYGRNLLTEPHLLVVATALPFILPIPASGTFGMNFGTWLLPGQLVWLPLLPMAAFGGYWVLRERTAERLTLLLFVLGTAVGVALAGYFSNPRYLVQVVPLIMVFAAVGLRELRRWWMLYGLALASAATVLLLYALAKGMA
jgi:4-amino-4-deoxy-L-arabinose transferase-like glycosyltransferase